MAPLTPNLLLGDCVEVMAGLEAESIDAIVTDPPYGLEFMGKAWDRLDDVGQISHAGPKTPGDPRELGDRLRVDYSGSQNLKCGNCGRWAWDYPARKCVCERPDFPNWRAHQGRIQQDWHYRWGVEALRVLRPGGHLVAFGGSRTYHRLAAALEDVGFEIRDQLQWLYGSGFPKSLDVAKAIDRQRFDRPDVLRVTAWVAEARDAAGLTNAQIDDEFDFSGMAGHWTTQGEQPAVPTLDQVPQLLALLDADPPAEIRELLLDLNGRKGEPGDDWFRRPKIGEKDSGLDSGSGASVDFSESKGRNENGLIDVTGAGSEASAEWEGWGTALKPAHEPIVLARKPLIGTVASNVLAFGVGAINIGANRLPTTENTARARTGEDFGLINDDGWNPTPGTNAGDPDGRYPANLLLDPEAAAVLDAQTGEGSSRFFYCAKVDRHERNAGLEHLETRPLNWSSGDESPGTFQAEGTERSVPNHHPTVKPVALMRWLVRLITPPGGTVLDPFLGSGSTGIAAYLETRDFVGIERDAGYLEIAEARLDHWSRQGVLPI